MYNYSYSGLRYVGFVGSDALGVHVSHLLIQLAEHELLVLCFVLPVRVHPVEGGGGGGEVLRVCVRGEGGGTYCALISSS